MPAFLHRPSIRLFAAAWQRLQDTNGNLYAAAITYFSFLALFPLLLLAVSILGFALHSHPDALQTLLTKITSNFPGQVGRTLQDSVKAAINARAGIGVIGLVGVVFTGLGWIGNLRASLDAVWKRQPPKQNPIKQRLVNLGVLVALGLSVLVSLGLTAGWAAFTHEVLVAVGLDNVPGMGTLLGALGIAVTIGADAVIFFLVLVRMPQQIDLPLQIGLRGALLASVGFEVLKIAGTYTVALSAQSATAGPFASVLAVLVWIQLVTRWMLFCAAWTAEAARGARVPEASVPVVARTDAPSPSAAAEVSPAAVGAALVGAGVVVGAAATAYGLRRRTSDD